eukprot:CAMPEP_0204318928 /NCGR_PEP_ID=MMETSP0469-20131031/6809_1 /ASSEMBLY_ACC=CAM_ASM_000384 /TAXON_ID=2969 /ORGANISM="Oxyrrhis marina" /LENGTH=522 /DNA_ID=CAMNT_0051300037 /DNA_START=8 /DNA_END=1576 /DNA_ORIENTATION=-
MSIEVQKRIKDNATEIRSYFDDLYKWQDEVKEQEAWRGTGAPATKAKFVPPPRTVAEAPQKKEAKKPAQKPGAKTAEGLARDVTPMPTYYKNWDKFDVDKELEKLDEEQEQAAKQSHHKPLTRDDGDINSKRTSTAQPNQRVNVKLGGRRRSPLDNAHTAKDEANKLFSSGRFREAYEVYTAALSYLERFTPEAQEQQREAFEKDPATAPPVEEEGFHLRAVLFCNRAMALLKMEGFHEVVKDCSIALELRPGMTKALFRRGIASAKLKRWKAAERDLSVVVEQDASDAKAAAELRVARGHLEKEKERVRQRAQRLMCDPKRRPAMPLRRLPIKIMGAPDQGPTEESQKGEQKARSATLELRSEGTSRAPYVPRALRLQQEAAARRQPAAAKPAAQAGTPAPRRVNFYTFEREWTAMKRNPEGRLKYLQSVGAELLPALFRESLTSELLAEMVETLSAARETQLPFAWQVFSALRGANRFGFILGLLSAEERFLVGDLFDAFLMEEVAPEETIEEVRLTYGV